MSIYQLPDRAYLRLSGPDAARYLNGQITQKVADACGGRTLWTGVTNAKAGLEGVGCITQLDSDSYLFDCPLELGDEMEARLDKYLIADDCEWVREDERWAVLVGVCESMDQSRGLCRLSNRFRHEMTELVVDLTRGDSPTEQELPEQVERELCARYAVPAWGRELETGMLPVEGGLHKLALSFDKGCYIGQEIVSRMEAAGKARTRLYQIRQPQPIDTTLCSTIARIDGDYVGLMIAKMPPQDKFPDAIITTY